MDTATLVGIVAAVFTLLGAFVSSVFGNYALKKQDQRKFQHEAEERKKDEARRRTIAYRRLGNIAEAVLGRSKEPPRTLFAREYEVIESIIAQDCDVLDASTVNYWDTRGEDKTFYADGGVRISVVCEAFWRDALKHSEEIKALVTPPRVTMTSLHTS